MTEMTEGEACTLGHEAVTNGTANKQLPNTVAIDTEGWIEPPQWSVVFCPIEIACDETLLEAWKLGVMNQAEWDRDEFVFFEKMCGLDDTDLL